MSWVLYLLSRAQNPGEGESSMDTKKDAINWQQSAKLRKDKSRINPGGPKGESVELRTRLLFLETSRKSWRLRQASAQEENISALEGRGTNI